MMVLMQKFFLRTLFIALAFTFAFPGGAQASEVATVHVFKREDCTYCKEESKFLTQLANQRSDFKIEWHDIVKSEDDRGIYQQITTLKQVPRITPITVIGDTLIQGFNSPETTGERIIAAVERTNEVGDITLEEFLATKATIEGEENAGCDSGDVCKVDNEFTYKLPLVGVVDLQSYSLGALSIVLGAVDGFNPCAMWVLITFLLILLQIGDRKKMIVIAGVFILGEAIMYGMILNVWYVAWDFVGLDQIVTPLVGALAIAGGVYFLYKYKKNRDALTCDVTDLETQGKIQEKITNIASAPLTIAAFFGIIGIAFSVNVIEFACSVGIPQAFTKILELNHLTFFETQWYTLLYILFYMIDDVIVFALAIWGFDKIHSAQKYSQFSLLAGGVLMIILGGLLAFAPSYLTF